MKDFLGREIQRGDIIVYPNRKSSSLWMNKARVIEVHENKLRIQRNGDVVRPLACVDRVVVVTQQLEANNANV